MRQRTEPSLSKDPSQSSRPLERSKLDKPERTAKVLPRNRPSAKLTITKVVLDLHKNALLLQSAHQVLDQAVHQAVHQADHQAVQLEALVLLDHEQSDRSCYVIHNQLMVNATIERY